ncbi:GNAT family N-acetyltransferase [Actinocorallia sp. A-T 12471]|uniref:GNAT family N-acetyltransferase n=1 Tax=Actinocorallia sp. A-T 12471 TaxID=3089813 RepID=UPI0029D11505|nr:GNAT family N-acetyltransferase [Actinocorallia sp. A-T 12471]MDX6741104.1 GNAT family N-acetyltransferase [Actinocorallia sp. A-T 12471]
MIRARPWDDPDAVRLRAAMAVEMEERYADRLAAFAGDLHVLDVDAAHVVHVAVAYDGAGTAVGHAALRRNGADLELKRMYIAPEARGTGVSKDLLAHVEDAARALGHRRVILQTGDRQPDAVRLYEREGYRHIPVFPPYAAITFSICMEKRL